MTLGSSSEVEDYIREYLSDTAKSREFAAEFVRRRHFEGVKFIDNSSNAAAALRSTAAGFQQPSNKKRKNKKKK